MSAEIDEYPSLRFQDIRKNQHRGRTHGWTDGQRENCIPPPPLPPHTRTYKQSLRGYNKKVKR